MHLVVVSHACVTDVNQQVYCEIEQLGHRVDIIVPKNFIAPGLTTEPIKVRRWPDFKGRIIEVPIVLNNSIPLHFYKKSLKKIISELNPDAIYVAEEPYSLSCFQVIRNSVPLKKAIGFYSAQNINKNYPFPIKKMENYVYDRSALAISISADVTNVLRTKGYKHSICEIPLGVDEQHFQISCEQKMEARKELSIPNEAFVVGFAGRIVEEKGVDVLCHAMKTCNENNVEMYLLIVGRGPLLKDIKILVTELELTDSVRFVDNASHTDMPKWFNCMDVHVLPSKTKSNWREQFGRVLIEAASCGVPSIGSTCGEIPKVLKTLSMDLVFEEGNVEELTRCLQEAYQTSFSEEDIRSDVIASYGNKGIANKLVEAFERVI
ncbi:glycosyltransferase [Evansella sp. AB-rgal1]|uniref:glycosyltransferase n=1 Tax=Evansella sp. AB-rgal1 TaxID=3242696 RepID=UPI00359CF253